MPHAADELVLEAPAKVNLFLEVLARRPDGYHEVVTLMQAVSLADRLRLRPARELILRLAGGSASAGVPEGEENLVLRAARLLAARAGARGAGGDARGAEISLEKEIPHGAGLGGGSSDAAAALVGLNRLWGLGLATAELEELAGELGADVPFFIRGGTAVCTGRGERVEPLPEAQALHYVLAVPPLHSPTGTIYQNLEVSDLTSPRRSVISIKSALVTGEMQEVGRELFNRLERPAFRIFPAIGELKGRLAARLPDGALMSGSGSAVFGPVRDTRAGRELFARLQEEGTVARFFCVRGLAPRVSPQPGRANE